MTGAIDPIRPIRRVQQRRREDQLRPRPREDAAVEVRISVTPATPPRSAKAPPASLDAHLIAQDAQMRGLKGGAERLEVARSAYLGAEFSGPNDRRPPKGLITRTEI
jgi:hypothetical protein